jgi:hypothetical protein
MVLAYLLTGAALAADCPGVQKTIAEAWRLFDDAEVASAKSLLDQANSDLACQSDLVEPEALLELYRLDGLVSLALDDPKGAVYATLRAVAADHLAAAPPPEYGPDLAELYATWSARLRETTIELTVEGGAVVFVDGRRADSGSPLEIVEGWHLVQVIDDMDIVSSTVVDLESDQVLYTGTLADESGVMLKPVATPAPAVLERTKARKRPAGLAAAGAAAVALGGAGIYVGYVEERRFVSDPYRDRYDACSPGSACYGEARSQAIRGDATRVRVLYGAGYGLAAVGAGLLTTWAIGLPLYTDGRTLGLSGRF